VSTGTTSRQPLTVDWFDDRITQTNQLLWMEGDTVRSYLQGVPSVTLNRIPTWEEARAALTVIGKWFSDTANEIFGRDVPPPPPFQQPPAVP
jgi:hypothetical protein